MRRIYLSLLMVLFVGFTFGNPITQSEAEKLATNFLKFEAGNQRSNFEIANIVAGKVKNLTAYYIINYKAGGFVIISADDRVEPILGYSTTNSIPEKITNSSYQSWLNNYANQIEYAVTNDLKNNDYVQKWNDLRNSIFPKGEKAVLPLITTTWDQDGVYNDLCPSNTFTGCVATAMAQIMNFWEFPQRGNSGNSYKHVTYGVLTADFTDTYDWDAIPNTGSITVSSPAAAKAAVAELMFECGVAVNMDYGTTGSGAMSDDVTYVLPNYFKYDFSTIRFLSIGDFASNEAWTAELKADIDLGHPVYYAGVDPAGGHAFVCDGYNEAGLLHFNFGWSGSGDGYYAVGAINPPGSAFNENNRAIVGIRPGSEQQNMMWVERCPGFTAASTYPGYISTVGEKVAWAIGRDGSGGNGNFRVYTKTKDGGLTWTNGTFTSFGTAYSMVHAVNADTAFIAVFGTGTTGNRIIKTTNGGTNWTSVLQGAGSASFFNVVHFFDDNNGVMQGDPVSNYYEINVTSNGGTTWTRVPSANIPAPVSGEFGITGLYTAVGDTIWFTTNRGRVYKSKDKGLTWSVYVIAASTGDTNIEIAFDETGQVGLASYVLSSVTTLYRTLDGGETWTLVNPTGNFYKSGVSAVPGLTNTFVSVGADYQTPFMGVSFTIDGGDTWYDFHDMYSEKQFVSIKMASPGKGYAGGFTGVIVSGTSDVTSGGVYVYGTGEKSITDISSACTNAEVNFTANYFGVASSDITWDFGADANPATAVGNGPHAVTYSSAGIKNVGFTVVSNSSTVTYETLFNVYGSASGNAGPITGTVTPQLNVVENYSIAPVTNADEYIWTLPASATGSSSTNAIDVVFNTVQVGTITVTPTNGCGVGASSELTITEVLSINEKEIVKINSFPNPAKDYYRIVADKNIKSIEVYSVTGQKISTIAVNNNEYTLNVSNLESGMYILNLNIDNSIVTKNFVKN